MAWKRFHVFELESTLTSCRAGPHPPHAWSHIHDPPPCFLSFPPSLSWHLLGHCSPRCRLHPGDREGDEISSPLPPAAFTAHKASVPRRLQHSRNFQRKVCAEPFSLGCHRTQEERSRGHRAGHSSAGAGLHPPHPCQGPLCSRYSGRGPSGPTRPTPAFSRRPTNRAFPNHGQVHGHCTFTSVQQSLFSSPKDPRE